MLKTSAVDFLQQVEMLYLKELSPFSIVKTNYGI
jgi:hypothetical protein